MVTETYSGKLGMLVALNEPNLSSIEKKANIEQEAKVISPDPLRGNFAQPKKGSFIIHVPTHGIHSGPFISIKKEGLKIKRINHKRGGDIWRKKNWDHASAVYFLSGANGCPLPVYKKKPECGFFCHQGSGLPRRKRVCQLKTPSMATTYYFYTKLC